MGSNGSLVFSATRHTFSDMSALLPLKKMSRAEKLIAMEELWQDLSCDSEVESPAWHEQVLRQTESLVRNGEAKFSDWEKAKKRIREKVGKGR